MRGPAFAIRWVLLFSLASLTCGPSGTRQAARSDPSLGASPSPDPDRSGKGGTGGRGGTSGEGTSATTDAAADAPASPPSAASTPPESPAPADPGDHTGASDAATGAPAPLGAPCSNVAACASGFCVDGICCDSACQGRCTTCNAVTSPGTCAPAAAGEDPRDDCATDPVASCGHDGTCDGAGNCHLYPAKTECEPGGCASPTAEKSARQCDGAGTCQSATTRACTGTACQNDSCGTTCANGIGCLPGYHCEAGASGASTCKVNRTNGMTCGTGGQCASGICSGGVCCDSTCDKACFACTVPGKIGVCSPAPAGSNPGTRCPTEPAASCGRDGTCDGAGHCRLRAAGTECGPATCDGNAAIAARKCSGMGDCDPATRNDCGAYACVNGACPTTCTAPTTGCTTGNVCSPTRTCVANGLVLRWRFDEPDGTVAQDSAGHGLDGTYVGGAAASTMLPPTKFTNPKSRAFDATKRQAAVIMTLPGALKLPTALTLSAWFRTAGIEAGGQGGEVISLGNNQLLRVSPTGFEVSKRIKKAAGGNDWVRCLSSPPTRTDQLDGKWHHLATVIDAATVRIFFDGAQVCSLANTDPLAYDRGGNFAVGRHGETGDTYDFAGNIDDVRVYDRALSVAEITSLAAGAE